MAGDAWEVGSDWELLDCDDCGGRLGGTRASCTCPNGAAQVVAMLRGSPGPSQAVAAPQPQGTPTTPDVFSVQGVRGRCTWPRGRGARPWVHAHSHARHAPAHIPVGASSPHALPRSLLCAPLADGRACDAGPLCWPLVVGLANSLAGGSSVQRHPRTPRGAAIAFH